MYCKHCGKELYDDQKFCTACGKANNNTPLQIGSISSDPTLTSNIVFTILALLMALSITVLPHESIPFIFSLPLFLLTVVLQVLYVVFTVCAVRLSNRNTYASNMSTLKLAEGTFISFISICCIIFISKYILIMAGVQILSTTLTCIYTVKQNEKIPLQERSAIQKILLALNIIMSIICIIMIIICAVQIFTAATLIFGLPLHLNF